MNSQVHFSSATDEWPTPRDFFDRLDAEFHFELDVCATAENAKCGRYFTRADDGLAQEWRGVCWLNPPYGREIAKWIAKASSSARDGATVVCLVPARTDTRWWHDHIWDASRNRPRRGVEVRLVRGRLRFGDAEASAPFPSAVVVFRPPTGTQTENQLALFGSDP